MSAQATAAQPVRSFTDIPGWFFWIDRLLFGTLLDAQAGSAPGVLVELGTYLGKSAVVIGEYLRAGDRFVALDLFGRTDLLDGSASTNTAEVQRSYATLSRPAFEANYLALHRQLPQVVEGLSSTITAHVGPGTARFIHVDASHLYEQVAVDVANTRLLLRPGGVAVFDDWRSEHTPGVGAAIWEAVFTAGLIPLALTPYKFYGVYADPEPYRAAVAHLVDENANVWAEEQLIAGHPVYRLKLREAKKKAAPAPLALTDPQLDELARRLADRLAPQLTVALERGPFG